MYLTITVDGDPKEIAALASELREQREKPAALSPAELAEKLSQHLQNRVESYQT